MNHDLSHTPAFYQSIRVILMEARRRAYTSVNHIMIEAYWKVGRRIVEEEQAGKKHAEYGSFLIRELSRRLGDEFGKGFSVANLKNFRQFYLTFPDLKKGYALRSELTWTHYRLIMRVNDPNVGRQFRISSETSHFYIDLVFYNYLLKCFVLIDLKTGKLTHQDIGQMDMYVRMFDDLKRGEDDNPTVGIVLCADKDETLVRYSVLHESEQLFASKYLRVLPTEEELKRELEARHVLEIDRETDNIDEEYNK